MRTFVAALIITLVTSSCSSTRGLTEQWIKNNVQEHQPGAYDEIRTYGVMKKINNEKHSYLELTGYKYKGERGLVIGVDKYYHSRPQFLGDNTVAVRYGYTVLTREEASRLLEACSQLKARTASAEKPQIGEDAYQDFTITKDVFLSYKRGEGGTKPSLWVFGEKYEMSHLILTRKLSKFLKY